MYMPGKFGLRIEDMVLVTATGGEVLTPSAEGLDRAIGEGRCNRNTVPQQAREET